MAKRSGLGSGLIVGVYDISGDIGSLSSINSTREVLDVTGIDKSAPEKIMGRKDGALTFLSFWNTTPGQAHPVLSALPTTNVQVTYIGGTTLGEVAASMMAKQTNYAPSLGANGSLTATTNAVANGYGLEWGELLTTGKQTFAGGTALGTTFGTAIDLVTAYGTGFGTTTSFGAAAYAHDISIASGTATVFIQDSADGTAFTTLTGMTFTAASAAGTERIQGATNATVKEFVRVGVSGVYTNLVSLVNFVRYFE
jgi:hypothetical protein